MESTIQLFRHLYSVLPPLVPSPLKKKMEQALVRLEKDDTLSLQQIEDTMITFGYEIWPWNQAYREFLAISETAMGQHFMLPKLSPETADRFQDFLLYGGTFRDLHSGRPADYFSPEEREEIKEALITAQHELRDYTDRAVMGPEKNNYLKKVREFSAILDNITQILNNLSELAKHEQDHPSLADQIRARIRSFEFGLCLLGPELDYRAVEESLGFFSGRREELNRLKVLDVI